MSCADDQAAGGIVESAYAWLWWRLCYAICADGHWTYRKAGHVVSSIPIVAVLTGARAWRCVTVGCGAAHAGLARSQTLQIR